MGERQAKEVWSLEEASRAQQQLMKDYELQAEKARQNEISVAQTQVRTEFSKVEADLRKELEEAKKQTKREKEELLERVRIAEGELRQREGERDEARKFAQE